jgi:hypothetical protein
VSFQKGFEFICVDSKKRKGRLSSVLCEIPS